MKLVAVGLTAGWRRWVEPGFIPLVPSEAHNASKICVPQKRQGLQIATLHILWGGCPKHRWQVTLVLVLMGSKQVLRELEQTASQRLALLSPIFSECGRQLTIYKVQ